jgi:hypothetical protein
MFEYDIAMRKCPYCGAEIPEDTIYCRVCKRSLISSPGSSLDPWPPLPITILMSLVVLLLVFLLTFDLYRLQPVLAGFFVLLASLLLGFLAARGRYAFPGLRQYLVSMLISLIPLIGTLYSAFFAARYAAGRRGLRLSLIALLMVVVLSVAFLNSNLAERLPVAGLLARYQVTPTPVLTLVVPTSQPTSTTAPRTPTRPASSPTAPADTPVAETGALPVDCIPWDQLTPEMVGEKVCATGDYLDYTQKKDETWVLSFSEDPGTFQVWSSPKRPIERFLPPEGEKCVVATGWLKTSGVRLIIIIGAQGELGPCP